VATHKGQINFDDILFERRDQEIRELAERVELIYDEELDNYFPETMPTIIEVTTRDGRVFAEREDSARGTPENPMTSHELRKKYHRLAETALDEEVANDIERAVDRLDKMGDVGELAELLRWMQ
jgi:2-methylcitrate dehydratase PrpD